jgi:hypothetical protein
VDGSIVRLPKQIRGDFAVFVNGVAQREGEDYTLRGRELHFTRELKQEGRLGLWRWFLGAWGIGTYRQNDSVDLRCAVGGRPQVAQGLEIEPAPDAPARARKV